MNKAFSLYIELYIKIRPSGSYEVFLLTPTKNHNEAKQPVPPPATDPTMIYVMVNIWCVQLKTL